MSIKKGDTVYVIAGRDKGKQGTVEQVQPEESRVVVNGVNIRKHHLKPSKIRPKGGIAEYPAPFSIANVMLLCPHCSKTSRTKSAVGEDNKKYRVCTHCGGSLERN